MIEGLPVKIFWLPLFFVLLCPFALKASHIAGGEISVKWINGNNFEVTLIYYSDCTSGSIAYAPTISVGLFDAFSNAMQDNFIIDLSAPPTKLTLGDSCFTTGICIEQGVYIKTVVIPDNPNGYYLSCQINSRNTSILNILSVPSPTTGITIYAEISNPALHNSTPVFDSYPNAFMCVNLANSISFSCTDSDGDSLVYYLETPLDSRDKSILYPAAQSKPYTPIAWVNVPSKPYYNVANMIGGDPAMTIDSETGVITANPDVLGLFVIVVRVAEYNKATKMKLGEIRRDIRYTMLSCNNDSPPAFTAPTEDTYHVCAGDSLCFNVTLEDPNTNDSVFFSATSEMFDGLPGQPRAVFSSQKGIKTIDTLFCIYPTFDNISNIPYRVIFNGRDSSCYGINTISKTVDFYVCPFVFYIPKAFSPNNDGLNDEFFANASFFKEFEMLIFDRWGNVVFKAIDINEKWNGKKIRNGKEAAQEGVYIYLCYITDMFDGKHTFTGTLTLLK